MSAEIANILRAAKALIQTPESWCQGDDSVHGQDGRVARCSKQAIAEAAGNAKDRQHYRAAAYNALLRAADAEAPIACGWTGICAWQDVPERTHIQVMDAFDHAIAAEEALAGVKP